MCGVFLKITTGENKKKYSKNKEINNVLLYKYFSDNCINFILIKIHSIGNVPVLGECMKPCLLFYLNMMIQVSPQPAATCILIKQKRLEHMQEFSLIVSEIHKLSMPLS